MDVYYKYWEGTYYEVRGAGPALVLLHGYCDDHTVWSRIIGELEKNFTLIMPDIPGFGKSEICTPQTVETIAEKIDAVVKAEKLEEFVLIGHSMGGYVALAYAEKYSDKLTGLGLFHSNAIADSEEKKINRNKTIEFVEKHGVTPFADTFVPNLFADGYDDKQVIAETYQKANSCSTEAVVETAKALRDRPDRKHILEQLNCPVLMVAGKGDKIVPYQLTLDIAALPKIAKIEVMEKAGHMGMLEASKQSATILKEFTQFCFDRK